MPAELEYLLKYNIYKHSYTLSDKSQSSPVVNLLNLRQNLRQMMAKASQNKRSYTKLWLPVLCRRNSEKWRKIKENQYFQGVFKA